MCCAEQNVSNDMSLRRGGRNLFITTGSFKGVLKKRKNKQDSFQAFATSTYHASTPVYLRALLFDASRRSSRKRRSQDPAICFSSHWDIRSHRREKATPTHRRGLCCSGSYRHARYVSVIQSGILPAPPPPPKPAKLASQAAG